MRLISRPLMLWLCAAAPFFAGAAHAQTITLSPGYVSIGVNQTVQYTATVTGLANTAVTWEVNGVIGGNSKVGTITQKGLYTALPRCPRSAL
jgi:hypothetical protein